MDNKKLDKKELKLEQILLVNNNIQMRDMLIDALRLAEEKIIKLQIENQELSEKLKEN